MTDFLTAVQHGLFLGLTIGAGAVGALTTWLTTRARAEFREDFVAACDATGWGTEALSTETHTARSRLSAQRNGHAPLSILGRLADFADLEVAFIKRRAPRHGLVVVEHAELQRLIVTAQTFFATRATRMDMEHTA